MERERRGEGIASIGMAIAKADLGEMQDGGEMERLELQRTADIVQAFLVPPEQIVEGRALVPGFGIEGYAAQQHCQSRFSNVVAARGNVASGRLEDSRR